MDVDCFHHNIWAGWELATLKLKEAGAPYPVTYGGESIGRRIRSCRGRLGRYSVSLHDAFLCCMSMATVDRQASGQSLGTCIQSCYDGSWRVGRELHASQDMGVVDRQASGLQHVDVLQLSMQGSVQRRLCLWQRVKDQVAGSSRKLP